MKKIVFIFSILILAVIVSAGSATAQNVSKVGVNVPFEFNFGGKAYAAGRYTVQVKSNSDSSAVITLNDQAGRGLQSVIATINNQTAQEENAKLSFDKANGQVALTGVVLLNRGYDLPTSGSGELASTKNRESRKDKKKTKST